MFAQVAATQLSSKELVRLLAATSSRPGRPPATRGYNLADLAVPFARFLRHDPSDHTLLAA